MDFSEYIINVGNTKMTITHDEEDEGVLISIEPRSKEEEGFLHILIPYHKVKEIAALLNAMDKWNP